MSKILIIGAGAMGSAFTFPCVDNKHDVTLIGSPLENDQIENLNKDSFHKHLNCKLSDKIVFLNFKCSQIILAQCELWNNFLLISADC